MSFISFIDNFLNSITMYRLVFYGLSILAAIGIILGFSGLLSLSGFSLLVSITVLLSICYLGNYFFSRLLHAPTNVESAFITAFILFLILTPATTIPEMITLIGAGILAMASKYIFAIHKKHLFNPAAITAIIIGMITPFGAIWWIGNSIFLPATAIIGLLIVRKIRRFSLFFSFFLTGIFTSILFGIWNKTDLIQLLFQIITTWPTIFFGTIMLTEPVTTPPTRKLQIIYGSIVGILFGAQFHIWTLYSTPELALVVGNIYSYLVSSKQRLLLTLKEITRIAPFIYTFVFLPDQKFTFTPGQYLEWTLAHPHFDSRGNRRYFTIASSPTEKTLQLGVKIPSDKKSSFKHALLQLKPGDTIAAGQCAGDFVLPEKKTEKLVFIAGGIGITPFRSMIKYLIETNDKRDIVLFYACSDPSEFVYLDLFAQAEKTAGVKMIYTITNPELVPVAWKGEIGRITPFMITNTIPDYHERTYYLSGPNTMVNGYKTLLQQLHIPSSHIKTDYFPGY